MKRPCLNVWKSLINSWWMKTEMLLSLPLFVAQTPPPAISLTFFLSLLLLWSAHSSFLFVYRDFQRFRHLELHLQNKSSSKLRDKFGNWIYMVRKAGEGWWNPGGIICFSTPESWCKYQAITPLHQAMFGRCQRNFFIQKDDFLAHFCTLTHCPRNTPIIWWHLHCNLKTMDQEVTNATEAPVGTQPWAPKFSLSRKLWNITAWWIHCIAAGRNFCKIVAILFCTRQPSCPLQIYIYIYMKSIHKI